MAGSDRDDKDSLNFREDWDEKSPKGLQREAAGRDGNLDGGAGKVMTGIMVVGILLWAVVQSAVAMSLDCIFFQ